MANQAEILRLVASGEMSAEDAETALARPVKARVNDPKYSDDGKTFRGVTVSVTGLNRFPVTLYHSQWIRLLAIGESITEACEEASTTEAKIREASKS